MRLSHRSYVSYIDKSREFYAAHGYETPYQWVSYDDVPFSPLSVPIEQAKVALLTTTLISKDYKDQTFAAPASPAPDAMLTDQLSWHKTATTTEDLGSYLPLDHLANAAQDGAIGAANERFYGIPTLYSQAATTRNAEQVVEWCREDDVDLVLLAPL